MDFLTSALRGLLGLAVLLLAFCAQAPGAVGQAPGEADVRGFLEGAVLVMEAEGRPPAVAEFLPGGGLLIDPDPGQAFSHPRFRTDAWALQTIDGTPHLVMDPSDPRYSVLWRIESLDSDRMEGVTQWEDQEPRLSLTRAALDGPDPRLEMRDAIMGEWTLYRVGDQAVPDGAPPITYAFHPDGSAVVDTGGTPSVFGDEAPRVLQGSWFLSGQYWDLYSVLDDERIAGPLVVLTMQEPAGSVLFVVTEISEDRLVLRTDGMLNLPAALHFRR